jgi:hypothetical protein
MPFAFPPESMFAFTGIPNEFEKRLELVFASRIDRDFQALSSPS